MHVKRPDEDALIASGGDVPVMQFLISDVKGEVLGVSNENKIYQLNCAGGRISCELKGTVSALLEGEGVNSVCMDRKGRLWFNTTLGRVLRSDETMNVFENVPLDDEIDDCTILGLLSDKNSVWIITNKKVLQYNIDSQAYQNYSTADENIMVDVFRYKAISLDGWGGLYVGGHRGFIHIRPEGAGPANKVRPTLHITDVKVEDRSIFFGGESGSEANTIRKIFLNPNDRNIEIFFSPLVYALNAHHRIAYQLDGVDHGWIYADPGPGFRFLQPLAERNL